jgi:hypothetical protein
MNVEMLGTGAQHLHIDEMLDLQRAVQEGGL